MNLNGLGILWRRYDLWQHPIAGHFCGNNDSTHDSRQVSMGLTFVALYDHGFVRQHRPRKAPKNATGTVKPTAWQQQNMWVFRYQLRTEDSCSRCVYAACYYFGHGIPHCMESINEFEKNQYLRPCRGVFFNKSQFVPAWPYLHAVPKVWKK